MTTDAAPINIIHTIETARALHNVLGLPTDQPPAPDEYPEYSRGMANIIGDLYGFDQDDIGNIIRVIRGLDSIASFALLTLQTPWMSDPTPSERQIATRRELAEWLESRVQRADEADLAAQEATRR